MYAIYLFGLPYSVQGRRFDIYACGYIYASWHSRPGPIYQPDSTVGSGRYQSVYIGPGFTTRVGTVCTTVQHEMFKIDDQIVGTIGG